MKLTAALVLAGLASPAMAAALVSERAAGPSIDVPLSRKTPLGKANTVDGAVDLDLVRKELRRLRGRYSARFHAYEKQVGKKHPLDARPASTKHERVATSGVVPLQDIGQGELWSGPVSFGTPVQTFTLDFDTGSSDLIVNPQVYSPRKSSTSKRTGYSFFTSYGDGSSANGPVFKDTISIGKLKAKATAIGISQQSFVDGTDGLAGMAFPVLATFPYCKPFFYTLIEAGAVTTKAFVMKLATSGSTLTLGAKAPNSTYVPVTNPSYWTVSSKVDGIPITAIIDSGTSMIVGDPATVKKLFKSQGVQYQTDSDGNVYGVYPCSKPPKFTFKFGAKAISLGPQVGYGNSPGAQTCYTSIIGADIGAGGWVVGDPLFQRAAITFDVAGQAVGFA